ncbi:MAG: DUF3667 domain-containing protein [Saprospiraceae bacterium]
MKKRLRKAQCDNCAASILPESNFCPQCGQENHNPNQSIGHLLLEMMESLFHFDTKIFVTLKNLIIYPGKMTLDFIENRRAKYVPPFRLYIFVSAIFFLVLNATKVSNVDKELEQVQINNADTIEDQQQIDIFGVHLDAKDIKFKNYLKYSDRQLDSALTADNNGVEPGFIAKTLTKQFVKLQKNNSDFVKSIMHLWVKYISIMMFILMPIFAFLLWLMLYRRRKNYYEYLIFSLHYHTLCFIIFIFLIGISYFIWNAKLGFIFFILPFFILYKSLRRNYNTSRVKTIFATTALNFTYGFILCFGILFALIIGALNA